MLNDFVTIIIPVVLGLAAGLGGAMMLSTSPEQNRAAKGAFYIAGACLWFLGVSLSLHAEGPLLMKIVVAAIIGAIAAGGSVYFVSLTYAQIAEPKKMVDEEKSGKDVNQNNSGAPNFNVPGSNNTFNYNTPSLPSIPQRDPDGLYQLGEMVATISGANVDVGNSTITFQIVRSQGRLDSKREIEYRDFVIECDGLAGAPRPNVNVGIYMGMTVGAKCKIIRKR